MSHVRGSSGFQVTGMIEGFFLGFEILDFGILIFWGWKILASIFWGIQNNLKILDSSHVSQLRSSANGIFLGFDFCLHSVIPDT